MQNKVLGSGKISIQNKGVLFAQYQLILVLGLRYLAGGPT